MRISFGRVMMEAHVGEASKKNRTRWKNSGGCPWTRGKTKGAVWSTELFGGVNHEIDDLAGG